MCASQRSLRRTDARRRRLEGIRRDRMVREAIIQFAFLRNERRPKWATLLAQLIQ